jgi:ATP-binding cassette subfamily B protein
VRFFARLFPYVLRYRQRFAVGLLALTGAAIIAVTTPLVIGEAVDDLRDDLSTGRLLWYAALIIAIQAGDSGLRFITRVFVSGSSRRVEYDLRNDVYLHMQSMDQKFFHENQTGDLMARVSNDVTTVREILGPGLMDLIRSIEMFIAGFVIMLTIDVKLALLAAAPLPLISLLFVWVASPVRASSRRTFRKTTKQTCLNGKRLSSSARTWSGRDSRWRSGRCCSCSPV